MIPQAGASVYLQDLSCSRKTPTIEATCSTVSADSRLRKPAFAPNVLFSLVQSPRGFVNGQRSTIPHACIHHTAKTTPDIIEGGGAVRLIGAYKAEGLNAPGAFEMADLAQLYCVGAFSHTAFHHAHPELDPSSTTNTTYSPTQPTQSHPQFPYYEDFKFDPTMLSLVGYPPVHSDMMTLIA